MHLQAYSYCNDAFVKEAINILQKCYDISPEGIAMLEKTYNTFANNFNEETSSEIKAIEKCLCSPKCEDSFLREFNDCHMSGIDLPVLIEPNNHQNGKTIFIVGEDPLRNKGNHDKSKIILSTPYGTHLKKYKDNGIGRLYWNVSTMILDKGYSLYYTDVFKLWMRDNGQSKIEIKTNAILYKLFLSTIEYEVNHFKPCAIITYGKAAENAVKQFANDLQLQCEVVSFIHPSWLNNKRWKNLLTNEKTMIEGSLNQQKEGYIKNHLANL